MNEFKFRFVNVLFFLLLLGSSYWAFQKMNPHFHYTAEDVVVTEGEEQTSGFDHYDVDVSADEYHQDTAQAESQENGGEVSSSQEEGSEEDSTVSEKEAKEESPSLDEEHRFLLTKLQGLIDDKIYMKKGSHGTRVGTVQKFLNLYFDKKIAVDNEYGPNTMYLVRKFQQKEGLSPDGLAGPETYEMMIDLIEKGKV